ncbi:MAG TPA: hypothetical protein VHC97_11305 [Thermoanaerobaculia bacterium]|jgi:hypothetical protein|nr:hypothetical protein [Thermoanaerobaculia bacterium]
MRHFAVRFAAILILVLGLAPMASAAELWTFAHFVETDQTQTAGSFDSVLYLMNYGNPAVHNCWVVLRNATGKQLFVNGQEVCPDVLTRQSSPCQVTVDGGVTFKIHDRIVQAGGFGANTVVLGQVRLRCNESMSNLNATLFVTNYLEDGFHASYAIDNGKIVQIP